MKFFWPLLVVIAAADLTLELAKIKDVKLIIATKLPRLTAHFDASKRIDHMPSGRSWIPPTSSKFTISPYHESKAEAIDHLYQIWHKIMLSFDEMDTKAFNHNVEVFKGYSDLLDRPVTQIPRSRQEPTEEQLEAGRWASNEAAGFN